MQFNNQSDIWRNVGLGVAKVISEARKDAAQAGASTRQEPQPSASQQPAADVVEPAANPAVTQAGPAGAQNGPAAALKPPQATTTLSEAAFYACQVGTKYLTDLLLKWAEGEDPSNVDAFVDRLDMARVELRVLGAQDAEILIHRLRRDVLVALEATTPEQRHTLEEKWNACKNAYEQRRLQLRQQQHIPVEPSSSVSLSSRVNDAQAEAIFEILVQTPYCHPQTHKVVRKPESVAALLDAYRRTGGTQMSEGQAAAVRLAMGVVKRGGEPLQSAHLKTEAQG